MAEETKISITDVTLRDGMHAVKHQFSVKDAEEIAAALDRIGVTHIEAAHGDGLGGSSVQFGFSKETEADYLKAVCGTVKNAKVTALLLPGIGTVDDMKRAAEYGIQSVRIATHCTEADISEQHIGEARKMGLETVGFLMMSH
jgi:4-hydroxy-2-oxovalerate/4-hydroxy-2-oxohexanoate aldolase